MKKVQNSFKRRVGKYIIRKDKPIGKGGYSIVYQGYQETTKKLIAAKNINIQDFDQDFFSLQAFQNQLKILKFIKSDNIIKFLDSFQTQKSIYIITELAQGGTLRKLITQNKRFSQNQAINYILQILNGFKQLIRFGILHRDLKPENILMQNKSLKLADFGCAKFSINNSYMKTIVGTPSYMAPQVLLNEYYSYKCDIWSLGIIFYQFLYGKLPWKKQTHENLIDIIQSKPLEFPQQIEVSLQVKQFISNCLQIQQVSRYDWQQIYTHPLFKESFKINFVGDKKDSIKLSFIIADFRMAFNSKNLNLQTLKEKQLPNKLNLQEFRDFIKSITNHFSQKQVQIFYQNCKSQMKVKSNYIPIQQFIQYLKKLGFRQKPKTLQINIQNNDSQEQQLTTTQKTKVNLLNSLKESLNQKSSIVNTIFNQKQKIEQNKLIKCQEFENIIQKIFKCNKKCQYETLFKLIDTNKDGLINFKQLVNFLQKVLGTVSLKKWKF